MIHDFSQYKYLFLDRDGVINEERPNDYVKTVDEFIFIDGAAESISIFTELFEHIFVVTNQRGVGRQKMTLGDLINVHNYMNTEIAKEAGKIDKIYFCSDLNNSSINRKPNIGMAFQAQADFPEVDFSKSILVGNSISDIHFGNKLGMLTVLVGDKYPSNHSIYKEASIYCKDLKEFADIINKDIK